MNSSDLVNMSDTLLKNCSVLNVGLCSRADARHEHCICKMLHQFKSNSVSQKANLLHLI